MSQFEYVTVLASIVVAFALSEVLSTWGALARNRGRVRMGWLHLGWSALVFLGLLQIWWGTWQYRDVEFTSFLSLLLLLAAPLTLSFAVFVLQPPWSDSGPIDLRVQFDANRRIFFLLLALVLVELCVVDGVVARQPVAHPENAVRLIGVVGMSVLAFVGSPRVQRLGLAVSFLLFLLFLRVAYRAL